MKSELEKLLNEFGSNLTIHEYKQYIPKLRDYFFTYILDNHGTHINAAEWFTHKFNKWEIIESARYYILKNEYVTGKAEIDHYLIALNRFYEELLKERFHNSTVDSVRPFTQLSNEVEKYIESKDGRTLLDRQKFPTMEDVHFEYVKSYLSNRSNPTDKGKQEKIIFELLLLYGSKFEKIISMKKSDYDTETQRLKVYYDENGNNKEICLELPFGLKNKITEILSVSTSASDKMFTQSGDNDIANNFLTHSLDNIKKAFIIDNPKLDFDSNRFTPTGLAKYAIIQMILRGVNQSVIMQLTGMGLDIISDCQEYINLNIESIPKDRYVNYKIRGIKTYDEFNEY